MIITTAGAVALRDALTDQYIDPIRPAFREQFERERVGRWTEQPKCHNRPWHPVTWHPGKGVAAAGWMCDDCGEYL